MRSAYDMLGNAWEWVGDCWNGTMPARRPTAAPGPLGDCIEAGSARGAAGTSDRATRVAKRLKNWATRSGHDLGFRVARTLP
ncbi:MAG: SUMF1/EgtB/PvdO family nonheme iron enzyme [Betaproteobacteria bacterium]|nr:SUMF1/EgtB/PvdO family nonheme iron enzyme [Betaproteobacteria bacterium]